MLKQSPTLFPVGHWGYDYDDGDDNEEENEVFEGNVLTVRCRELEKILGLKGRRRMRRFSELHRKGKCVCYLSRISYA